MPKKTYVPEHSGLEFAQIIEQFKERSPEHERIAVALTEDSDVLTKDSSRLNKTALLRSVNKNAVDRPDFDPTNPDHYVEVDESEKINSRRLEELLEEFKRCFEHYE